MIEWRLTSQKHASKIQQRLDAMNDEMESLLQAIADEQVLAEQKLAQLELEAIRLRYQIATGAEQAKRIQDLRAVFDQHRHD